MGAKHGTRNTNRRTVPVKAAHKPGADKIEGSEARRLEYIEFCYEQSTLGYSQREIAIKLWEEFSLTEVPVHSTISTYLKEAAKLYTDSIKEMRERYLAVALPRLEKIIKNFLPRATGLDGRPILRREKCMGVEIEVLDEEAFEEQKKAAETVMKATEQARRLLGIGLAEKDEGEGKMSLLQFNNLITNTVNQTYVGADAPKHIGQAALTSGDPLIDKMENSIGI